MSDWRDRIKSATAVALRDVLNAAHEAHVAADIAQALAPSDENIEAAVAAAAGADYVRWVLTSWIARELDPMPVREQVEAESLQERCRQARQKARERCMAAFAKAEGQTAATGRRTRRGRLIKLLPAGP